MAETEQKPTTEEQTAPAKEEVKAEEAAPVVKENGEAGEGEKKEGEAAAVEGNENPAGGDGKEGEGGENQEGGEAGANGDAKKEEEAPAPEVCLDAPTENPLTDEDYQEMIKLDAAEAEEGWDKIKKHKEVIVYRKAEKNGTPVIKASMELAGIPAEKVLEFFTDPEQRRKWNKKSPTYEVLEEKEDFKVVYTVFKMPTACDDRDVVQCSVVKSEEEPVRHTILYKSCNHPSKPPNGKGHIRADVGVMGIVIKPKEGEEVATHVTWVGQVNLKGWMPKMMVNKVTVGYPVSIYDDLNSYWKKLTGQDTKKDKKDSKGEGEEKEGEDGEGGEGENGDADSPAENGEAEAKPDAAESEKPADAAESSPPAAEEKKEEAAPAAPAAAAEDKPAEEAAAE